MSCYVLKFNRLDMLFDIIAKNARILKGKSLDILAHKSTE